MIIRAAVVVTMAGPPIANGAVVVQGNKVLAVGPWAEMRARHSGEILDLGERILLPGLINAHCHLDYTDLRGTLPKTESFTAWIRAINARKAAWTEEDYLRSIRNGFAEATGFGTTTLINFEAFPELIAKLGDVPIRTWWLAEMIDVRKRVDLAEPILSSCLGLAPHAPFTASRELYEATARRGEKLVLSTHLAESREELRMFRDAGGPLFDFMQSIGRPMDDCGGTTPLATLLNYGILDDRWIVTHLNELSDDDLPLLTNAPRFSIAHCPRSHAYFGHSRFRLRELRELGFNICVGTDSLASNDDLSLFAELRQLARMEPELSPFELLEMVTTNAAAALGEAGTFGRIAPAYFADLIAIPKVENTQNAYEEIVACDGRSIWAMIDGRAREIA